MILIKGGHVVDPGTGRDGKYDILTEDDRITAVEENISQQQYPSAQIIYAGECIVAPGLVDVHSHFREPGQTEKETIYTGASAAAAGGYTSVVCMANTDPCTDNIQTLNYILERARNLDIHLYQDAALTINRSGSRLVDMRQLKEAGAAGFTDDGAPDLDENIVARAMAIAQELHVPLSFHEEDPAFVYEAGINEGDIAEKLGMQGASRQAEITLAERDLNLALRAGAVIDIQHVSAAETVELIRKAKSLEEEDIIHAEASPHHFSLTEDAILEYGTNAKVNPPLRTEADRQAIIRGLQDGTLDIIATDHAPHTALQKKQPFTSAPSGMTGLETALSLGITNLVQPGYIDMMKLIELMSLNPAKLYGLEAGSIEAGRIADLVIFSSTETRIISRFFSKSSNSPFIGKMLTGNVHYTIASGKIIYRCEGL